jgi:hypothetical protein
VLSLQNLLVIKDGIYTLAVLFSQLPTHNPKRQKLHVRVLTSWFIITGD